LTALAAYVSGHGFGHLVRLCEVLRQVRALRPDLPILVTGAVPAALVRGEVPGPVELREEACDVGLAQRDALEIDEPGTLARCRAFEAGWEARAAREAEVLRARRVSLVLADVPALAFDAAARAGVPAVGMGNFSWDWIYAHLARRQPGLQASAERAAQAYRTAALMLELPFTGDLSAFPRREQVGFVARRPRLPRAEVRRRLGWPDGPVALVSFGRVGLPALRPGGVEADPDVRYAFPEELSEARLQALGVRYPDVVGAADVVVTKPGYGIVTDAIAGGARLVYTERGDFPEYPIMVRELPAYLPCVHVSNAEVRAGRLRDPVHRALELPAVTPPELGGAERAARRVVELLEGPR
jgi:L-arabinokinase